jgi:hypothetical protein
MGNSTLFIRDYQVLSAPEDIAQPPHCGVGISITHARSDVRLLVELSHNVVLCVVMSARWVAVSLRSIYSRTLLHLPDG